MVTVQIAVVTWAVFRGFFYFNDDFAFRGQGARLPWFDPSYVFQDWMGHFMPAGFVLSQPLTKLGDFSYTWIALALAAGQALTSVLLLRLLVRNFGLRWRILLPLLVYLTSVAVVQATAWWAAGLSTVPLLACLVLLSDRTLRTRGQLTPGFTWWTGGIYAASLLFCERAVLLPIWVFALLVAMTPGGWWHAVRTTFRRHLRTWALLVAITLVWAVGYVLAHQDQPIHRPSLDQVSEQLGALVGQQLLPSLVGGGWSWLRVPGVAYDLGHAPAAVTALGLAVTVVGLFLLLPAGPRARRALGAGVVYGAAVVAVLAAGRMFYLYVTGDVTLPRYFAELAPATAVCLALATTRLVDDPSPEMLREYRPRPRPALIVPLLALAQVVVLLWITSVVGLVGITSSAKDRAWTLAALRSLRAASGTSPVLDQLVPSWVVDPLIWPANRYSWFFAGVHGIPPIGDITDRLRLLDDKGALVDAHVQGLSAPPGPVADCGYKVEPDGAWIPISKVVIPWAQTVQLAYISKYDTFVDVTFTQGETRRVRLAPGLHDVFFWLSGGGTAIHIKPSNPGEVLCIGAVRVGQPAVGANQSEPSS
jgi:hypothetical protein